MSVKKKYNVDLQITGATSNRYRKHNVKTFAHSVKSTKHIVDHKKKTGKCLQLFGLIDNWRI